MTLQAEGLNNSKSTRRAEEGGKDLIILIGQRWSSLGMPTKEFAQMFNTFVRAKYRYGLILTGVGEELNKQDDKWEELALRALVKTRKPIRRKGWRKLQALLQLERLEWPIEREAARTVRRWKEKAEEDGEEAKRAESCRRSLQQVIILAPQVPLRVPWQRLQDAEEEDWDATWVSRWNDETDPTDSTRSDELSLRLPRIQLRETFPQLLVAPTLTIGQKRNALRWFLYWFPRRGGVTR